MAQQPGRVPGFVTPPVPVEGEDLTPVAPASDAVVVHALDTGVAVRAGLPHPFLRDRLAGGWRTNIDEEGGRGADADGHGSFVAGVVLQHAPTAVVDVGRILDDPGPAGDDVAVAAALRGLIGLDGLAVVNLSFFGDVPELRPEGLEEALGALLDASPDLIVVIGAGNKGTCLPTYPAAFSQDFDRVIAVGATVPAAFPGVAPRRASFSNHGDWVTVFADGVDVLGPRFPTGPATPVPAGGGWCRWSGTSFSAPAVSGAIAATMTRDGHRSAVTAWNALQERAAPLDGGGRYLPLPVPVEGTT